MFLLARFVVDRPTARSTAGTATRSAATRWTSGAGPSWPGGILATIAGWLAGWGLPAVTFATAQA
jgi:hypothetical protein